MKSSWAWMMVLVALGSGLTRAQPQIDVRKLSGTWYPLATAMDRPEWGPITECKIQSNDTNSFDLITPFYFNKKCEKVRVTYIAKEGGGFQLKGDILTVHFIDTDYDNYLIVIFRTMLVRPRPKPALFLYGRKKDLTEEMKAKFQSQVSKMGYKQKDIHYRPEISSCQE